jgi:hypothetical protein
MYDFVLLTISEAIRLADCHYDESSLIWQFDCTYTCTWQ